MAVCFATPLFFSGNISLHSLKLVLLVLSSGGWAGARGLFLARDGVAGLSAGPGSTWEQLHSSSVSGLYSKVIKFVGTCCLLLWQAALKCLNHSIAFILLPA